MRYFNKRIFFSFIILAWCLHGLVIQGTAGDINTLNVAIYKSRIDTLDPHIQNSTEKCIALMNCEPLISMHRDTLKLEPKLATSWKISSDAKVFTLFLRKGVKFQDGTPFNAEAVKFNFDRVQNLKKGFYWMIEVLEKIEVLDDYTIRFTLKESFSPFIFVFPNFPIVSPKSVLDHEETKGDYAKKWYIDHAVGTGPYRFAEWQHGVKIVHEKYDEYWGGWKRKHCSKVINWEIPEAGTQRMMLEKGDLDIIQNFSTDDFNQFKNTPKITALEKDTMAPMLIRLNYVAGPTKDLKVRQALSYCLDRTVYEKAKGGRIQLPDGPCSKELLGGWKPNNVIIEYNPNKAKELLTEAGYPNGFEMSILIYPTPVNQMIAEVWQAGLSKAGVKLNIKVLPWPSLVTKLTNWAVERNPATAENSYLQFISPRLPDPYSFVFLAYNSKAQSGNGRNWMLYSNPRVDELGDKAIKTVDEKARMKIYREATQIIADECPDVYVDKVVERAVMRSVVKGFYFDPLFAFTTPYSDLYKTAP